MEERDPSAAKQIAEKLVALAAVALSG